MKERSRWCKNKNRRDWDVPVWIPSSISQVIIRNQMRASERHLADILVGSGFSSPGNNIDTGGILPLLLLRYPNARLLLSLIASRDEFQIITFPTLVVVVLLSTGRRMIRRHGSTKLSKWDTSSDHTEDTHSD